MPNAKAYRRAPTNGRIPGPVHSRYARVADPKKSVSSGFPRDPRTRGHLIDRLALRRHIQAQSGAPSAGGLVAAGQVQHVLRAAGERSNHTAPLPPCFLQVGMH